MRQAQVARGGLELVSFLDQSRLDAAGCGEWRGKGSLVVNREYALFEAKRIVDLEKMAKEAEGLRDEKGEEESEIEGGGGFDPSMVKQPQPVDFDVVLLWNPLQPEVEPETGGAEGGGRGSNA